MKVYLDDVRAPQYGDFGDDWADWIVVRTIANFRALLLRGGVQQVSVDYDLSESDPRHTGGDALQLIFDLVCSTPFIAPSIEIHSQHDRGREELQALRDKIVQASRANEQLRKSWA